MTLTITLPTELERRLRDEAARTGVNADLFVLRTLEEKLRPADPKARTESELLERVNLNIPPDTWQLYRDLIAKRDAETLTSEEHSQLIAISDQIEAENVRRIRDLTELARLRGTSLLDVMDQLGIGPIGDE